MKDSQIAIWTRGVAIATALGFGTGCAGGGDDGGRIIDASPFIGTWRNTAGAVTITCAEDPENPASLPTAGDTIVVQTGTESDLQILDEDCVLHMDIDGTSAHLVAPTTCTISDDDVSIALTLQAYTFTTEDGVTGSESGNGAVMPVGDVPELHCGFTVSGTLRKL